MFKTAFLSAGLDGQGKGQSRFADGEHVMALIASLPLAGSTASAPLHVAGATIPSSRF